ncbi:MAG: hypothetical protein AAB425_06370, partial [Bdellovibrionota bacterium]
MKANKGVSVIGNLISAPTEMCAEGRRSATFSLALNATYSRKLRSLVSFIHPRLFHITTANEALAFLEQNKDRKFF